MKLYIDTREQRPLEFQVDGVVTEVITTKLPYGDYAGAWEDKDGKHIEFMPVFFERKSLGDLYGTLGKGMERFRREMQRANEDGVKLIIIVEACFAEVKNGYEHSKMEGESILKTLHTLWVKHDIPYILCNDREDMQDTIIHMFTAIGRNFKPMRRKHHESETRAEESHERSLAERTDLVELSRVSGLRDAEKTDDEG
jgi:ERCC4-type nuclease